VANWDALTFSPYEIVVPTLQGEIEVPWSTIRLLSDKEYSAHLADAAEEEARQIGLRIKELRTSRNLSGKEVAERAGITPQSLSRIENGRHDIVFTTLRRILAAMGYSLKDLATAPEQPASLASLLQRLDKVGIDKDFVFRRLLPERNQKGIEEGQGPDDLHLIEQVGRAVSRVFHWSQSAILGNEPLHYDPALIAAARFKVRGRVNELRASAYTVYAHYLALCVLDATATLERRSLPSEPEALRRAVVAAYGEVSFEALLRFMWDRGVPVIPLHDPGAFHGACWRVSGRDVIVLKQVTASHARWLSDLAHEGKHVVTDLSDEHPTVVERKEISFVPDHYQESDEEWVATEFASNLVLFGRAEELAQQCVSEAGKSVERLKTAVQRVAEAEHVPVDALANYLAFRLQGQGINWWGVANNLQVQEPPPWQIARDILLDHVDLHRLNRHDQSLLLRALTNRGDG
jgi:transcriptional regulator with XRE-family HTH domain